MSARLVLLVLLALLALPATAPAAQRFAAPSGSGPEPCAEAVPCSLKVAVTKAKPGDEVIVGGGSYAVSEYLAPEGSPPNVFVHGDPSGPMPQIVGSSAATIVLPGSGGRMAYLDMSTSAPGGFAAYCAGFGNVLERIRATASGTAGIGIRMSSNCSVSDSVALATGLELVRRLSAKAGSAHPPTRCAT